MKVRNGYVSNSSSSSFLVCCNDMSVFDSLKNEEKAYSQLMNDIEDCSHREIRKIRDFFEEEYVGLMCNYKNWIIYVKNSWETVPDWKKKIETYLKNVCQNENIRNDLRKMIADEMSYIDGNYSLEKEYVMYKKFQESAKKFSNILCKHLNNHWKILSVFSYSDNDGDFGEYMEHEFMYKLPEKEGISLVIIKNEH